MKGQFVVVVSYHRRLGTLLLPFVLSRIEGHKFFQLDELIMPENISKLGFPMKEYQKQIAERTFEYSDKSIHDIVSKKLNLKDFFLQLEDEYIKDHIRPYIEKRIYSAIELILKHEVPLFRKDKNSKFIHEDEKINLVKEPAKAVFNFIRTPDEFKYFLSIRYNGTELALTRNPGEIITNVPCSLILGNNLYCINNIDAKKLLPFFTKDSISVPKTKEKEYIETFVKNAVVNYPVNASGFSIKDEFTIRKAILSFETNLAYEPVISIYFSYNEKIFTPREKQVVWTDLKEEDNSYTFYKTIRDMDWEQKMMGALKHTGLRSEENEGWYSLPHLKQLDKQLQTFEMINWMNMHKNRLIDKGFEFRTIGEFKQFYTGPIKLEMKLKDQTDWFDLQTVVTFGEYQIPFTRLKKNILHGIREYTLPNNEVAILPEEWFAKYKEILTLGETSTDHIILQRHHFNIVSEAMENERISKNLQKLQNDLHNPEQRIVEVPEKLNGELRSYQREGYFWMHQLYKHHFGGCLADDMGLGKTVQTISLLLKIKEELGQQNEDYLAHANQLKLFDLHAQTNTPRNPTSLIVMPVSLIHNWEREIRKFAPSLKVYKYTGTQRIKNIDSFSEVDVVLSTYGIVRNEAENISKFRFKFIILDESQVIKNPESKTYKAILTLDSEHKIALTGTPIENSLTDLWAQLNFLNKGLLGSQQYFVNEYVNPIEKSKDEQKQGKLQTLISPFILRRKKEEVATELPPVTEQVIYCDMTEKQKSIYESEKSMIRNHLLQNIEAVGIEKSAIQILKALNRMRLLSNHPVLAMNDYEGDSGKYDEITRRIESIIEGGHKVLIFSFYVMHLNLIQKFMDEKKWKYSKLIGQMNEKERKKEIDKFCSDTDNHIFLISLKAGGLGLNLTAADYVFILDPWWNPAVEDQAVSRAHRIGQEKNVFVYRFISKETIEEKILLLQDRKSELAETFINTNNPFKAINKDTVDALFS